MRGMAVMMMFVFSLFTLAGCAPGWWRPGLYTGSNSEQGGSEADLVIELPIAAGDAVMCVQGAGGDWSHSSASTSHDLDLDTSNVERQEVYAPVSGVAYVHTESASANFGYHVNIDVGDGTYIVIAHMDEVFLADVVDVGAGQLLGYEGCTGSCTGDHIHIGRHEGDPALKAEFGTSVEVWYNVADATVNGEFATVSGDDFICGIKSEGDPQDGHTYQSELGVARWHPSGALVKTPDNAKTYLLEDGLARWFVNEDVFWSQGYDFVNALLISDEELDCLGTGSDIVTSGFIDAAYDSETGSLWLVVGTSVDPDRYRIEVRETGWWSVLASWGSGYSNADPPPVLDPDHTYFTAWPVQSGYAPFRDGTVLREETASDVYVISDGAALPVRDWDTLLLMGYQSDAILWIDDGVLRTVHERVGDCSADVLCIDREAVVTCGGGLELSDNDLGGPENTSETTEETEGSETEEDPQEEEEVGAEPEEGEDETEEEDADTGVIDEIAVESGTLTVSWTTPFGWVANDITLSGEYIFADGSYGFTWRELDTVVLDDDIVYEIVGAGSGDTFRFSVEYEDSGGNVSWSCIGPYPPGTREGTAVADVDGTNLVITEVGDPTGLTSGCGLFLTVP